VTGTRRRRSARSDPLRVAVVGLGYWGPNLVRNLYELPEAEVTVVCDLSEEMLAKIALRYPAVAVTTRYADVLDDPDVDAVTIATPVSTHYELAAAALGAGKHAFVEKPFAASLAEAKDLVASAAELGLVVMPGHTFLYSPPVQLIRDLIRSGELGEIYFVSTSRVNLGLHQPDVSVVWDLGPHDFSILRYWLDENPDGVTAVSRGCILPRTPDVAFVTLTFPSGTLAHVELSWLAPSKLRRTAVVGSRKMVVYDDTSNEPVRIFDSGVDLPDPESFGEYKLSYRSGAIISPPVAGTEPLALELRDFCQAVRTGEPPVSSTQIGLDVVQTIEAVDRALAAAAAPQPLEVASAAAVAS
jgi:predicted dehydrogenase